MGLPLAVNHAIVYNLIVRSSMPAPPLVITQFSFRPKDAVPKPVSSVGL